QCRIRKCPLPVAGRLLPVACFRIAKRGSLWAPVLRPRLIVLALLLAAAPPSFAQSPQPAPPAGGGHVYLSWVRLAGAESCPDVRQIADDVTGRLGWNPFRESPNQFIEAQIRRDVSWVAEIFLRDANGASHGNRVFTSNAPTCASLASVVALSIAIIID